MKKMTSGGSRVSRMINPVADANGNYKYGKWAVRSPGRGGVTEFRIFPAVVDGEIIPQYVDTDIYRDDKTDHISDAAILVEACVCWGENHHTFLSPTPAALRALGLRKSPVKTMYWNLHDLKENRPTECPASVHALFKYERGKGSKMDKPKDILLFQGVLLKHAGEPTKDRDGNPKPWFPVVLQINQSTAQKAILDTMIIPKDASKPLSEENNSLGNIVGLNGHTILIEPRDVQVQVGTQTHYFVTLGEQMVLDPEQVKHNFVPWEDLLHFPTVEESITFMADAVGAEPVLLGLRNTEYESFIPAEVRTRGERLTTAPTPVVIPQVSQSAGVPLTAPMQAPAAPAPAAAAPAAPAPVAAAPAAPAPKTLSLDDAASPEDSALEPFTQDGGVPDQGALLGALHKAQSQLGAN